MTSKKLTSKQRAAKKGLKKTLRRFGIEVEMDFDEIVEDAMSKIADSFGTPDSLYMSHEAIEQMSKQFNGLSSILPKQDDSQDD